jgi:myo-inositol-1(or 4)-monophosphatase
MRKAEMTARSIPTDRYLEFALTVCREGGDILHEARRSGDIAVVSKGGMELLTSADLAVDHHFRRRVADTFRDHVILSEESGGHEISDRKPCWIIDPLDGTANFVHGQDHVAISAALSIDGEVVLGVVHAPFHGQTFWAARGQGAFRNGHEIEASRLTDVRRALIATGFPHHRGEIDTLVDRLKPLLKAFGDVRRLAAPALDICWVADGRLTGFVDRIHRWDVAAAGLIATEAGARLATFGTSSDRLKDDGTDYVVAAPGIFDRLCQTMRLAEAE